MGQVPQNLSYLVVGDGRLARHLCHYFSLLNQPHARWHHSADETLFEKAKDFSVLLLCVSDDAIGSLASELEPLDKILVAFSGAHEFPGVQSFHPLMTFGHELYDQSDYQNMAFVGTGTKESFHAIFPWLPNSYYQIQPEQKSLYHALCVLMGNGASLLWDRSMKSFGELNVPKQALGPYLQKCLENFLTDLPGRQTGPWYRSDQSTIAANEEALARSELLPIYQYLKNLAQSKELP